MNIIQKLLSYEDEKTFDRLKQAVGVQLHYIFFRIEKIIRVDARLEAKREDQLIGQFYSLLTKLDILDTYTKLFSPLVSDNEGTKEELLTYFPLVIAKLILDYTCPTLSSSREDEDAVIARILCIA